MSPDLSTESIRHAIEKLSERMSARTDELNSLDGELGDGDLGVTISRGISGLAAIGPQLSADMGMALDECAKAIIRVSGSTFGTLTATALQAMSVPLQGRTSVSYQEVRPLLEAAVKAIKERSGAASGDKTMVDSLEQIVADLGSESDPKRIHQCAVAASRRALEVFRPRPCRQGRARIFGGRTIGRDDPGMVAILYIVESLQ